MNRSEAIAGAKALKAKIGKGWKTRVYTDGLSWHYAAYNGTLSVLPSRVSGFHSLLSSDIPHCGNMCWSLDSHDKDPIKSAKKEIANARRKVNQCLRAVEAAEGAILPNSGFIEAKKLKKKMVTPGMTAFNKAMAIAPHDTFEEKCTLEDFAHDMARTIKKRIKP